MNLKRFLLGISFLAVLSALWGCGISHKPSCTLVVSTSYGGSGIDGQDLGSGSFKEVFEVSGGDVFYEDFDGHWTLDSKNMYEESLIMKIVKVEENGVTVQNGNEEIVISYSVERKVDSTFVVCDGINYSHKIRFSGYKGHETTSAEVSETEIIEDVTMGSEGFFLPCTNGSCLLIIDNYGPTELTPEDGDYSVFAGFSAGDRVKAVHGILLETYPARTSFYSIEKLSEGDISDIPADTLTNLEEMGWIAVSDNPDTVQTDETTADMTPTVLDRETDRRIRTDYAAYVSARDNREITADQVTGQFYYGNDNGYMLLVMCPSDSYTEEIREYKLQIMDIPDDDCDCYPYVDVMLPSGMFEMLAYKDGTFIDIETAISEKLISYDAALRIAEYMDLCYSDGDQLCLYKTNYIDD